MTERYDAVVVGGGIAGLIAARDLSAAGWRVLLLEARDRLAGRAYSRPFVGSAEIVELGGAWFDSGRQAPLREEAARYGVPIARSTVHTTARWFTGGTLRAGLPVPRGELADFERVLVALATTAASLRSATIEERLRFDVPLAGFLDRLDPTPATRDFFYGWICLLTGADPRASSALGVLSLVGHAGFHAFYTELVDTFPGGTGQLVAAIAADVPEIRLRSPVMAIRQERERVTIASSSGDVETRVCVLAVPVNAQRGITLDPPFTGRRLDAVINGHICRPWKIWMLASGVPAGLLGVGWGRPFYWLSAERCLGDAQLVVAFALAGTLDPRDHDAVTRALRVYAPEAEVRRLDFHDWSADPWSRGAWMSGPAGWTSAGIYQLLGQPHGRILIAGSDVAPEHAGWIAGAVSSGRAAAVEAQAMLTTGERRV